MPKKPNYFFFLSTYIKDQTERDRLRELFNNEFSDRPSMIRRSYSFQSNEISTFSLTSEEVISWDAMAKFRDAVLDSNEATLLQLLSNCTDYPPMKIEGFEAQPPRPTHVFAVSVVTDFKPSWIDWFRPSPLEVLIKKIEDQFYRFETEGRYSSGLNISGKRISLYMDSLKPIDVDLKTRTLGLFKDPNITIITTFEN